MDVLHNLFMAFLPLLWKIFNRRCGIIEPMLTVCLWGIVSILINDSHDMILKIEFDWKDTNRIYSANKTSLPFLRWWWNMRMSEGWTWMEQVCKWNKLPASFKDLNFFRAHLKNDYEFSAGVCEWLLTHTLLWTRCRFHFKAQDSKWKQREPTLS